MTAGSRDGLGLAFVLWRGAIGGAETYVASLAAVMRGSGIDARVVLLEYAAPLDERLRRDGIPFSALGFARGRDALRHPRRFAAEVRRSGPDGVVLQASGFLAPALRLGGYRGRIVAVEHGSVLQTRPEHRRSRAIERVDRLLGTAFVDRHVVVSDYVREHVGGRPVTIPNGVDLDLYRPATPSRPGDGPFVVGCVSRLIAGKGVEDVLAASRPVLDRGGRLRIAGDGPERTRLERLAAELGIGPAVTFEGWLGGASEIVAFWHGCDVAIAAPNDWVESFGLGAVEAMACGLPVVATRVGGLAETVVPGRTGALAAPRDTEALSAALVAYMDDPELVATHGASARARCEERYDIRRCAAQYADLFRDGASPG